MDFVVTVDRLPAPGETVLGSGFQMIPGGKGANQACAAGRLSRQALVRMVGRTGYDIFADQLKASLAASGVDVSAVAGVRSHATGVAMIQVDRTGQNSIVVASGANFAFRAADVEGIRSSFRGASFALFQLETPMDAVHAAMLLARGEGVRTILDPAPAALLSREFLSSVDILTPNETEACVLQGRPAARIETADAPEMVRDLLQLGPCAVILKMGDRGCWYADSGSEMHVPAYPVAAVDSTAAGDTFNGALAVALAESFTIQNALRFANAAAAISVTRPGAQASIPSRVETDALFSRQQTGAGS